MSHFDFYPDSPLDGLRGQLTNLAASREEIMLEFGSVQERLLLCQERLLRVNAVYAATERAIKILEAAEEKPI